jgi:hypothetical protein
MGQRITLDEAFGLPKGTRISLEEAFGVQPTPKQEPTAPVVAKQEEPATSPGPLLSPEEMMTPPPEVGSRFGRPQSVFNESVGLQQKQLPTDERYVLSPQFIKNVESQLNAMPSQAREVALKSMASRKDAYGRAARDIQGRYQALDKISIPEVTKRFDPRIERQVGRLVTEGEMDPQAAEFFAKRDILMGRTPQTLPIARPDEVAELAEAERQRVSQEMADSGFMDQVGALAASRARQTGLGLAQVYADVVGDDQFSTRLRGLRQVEKGREAGVPEADSIAGKSAQQAIATLASQGPMVILGALTGTAVPVLAQVGIESFAQAYGDARSAFKNPLEASTRASLMTTAELAFARYGLGEQFKAIRGLVNRVPTKELSGYLTASLIKEIPAEQATTLSQILVDKLPEIGMNPDAGMKDVFEAAAETLRQTVIQTGAMNASIYGASAAERGYSTKLLPAISQEAALARAIEADAARAGPTEAGLRAKSLTEQFKPLIPKEEAQPEEPEAKKPEAAPPKQPAPPSGRVEPTISFGDQIPAEPSGRVEPTFTAAPGAADVETVPGMVTEEDIEQPDVTLADANVREKRAEEPAEPPAAPGNQPRVGDTFSPEGWAEQENKINKKTGQPMLSEGRVRYTQTDDRGFYQTVLVKDDKVTSSNAKSPIIELTNTYLDLDAPVRGRVHVSNSDVQGLILSFIPEADSSAVATKMSPRAVEQYKAGVPIEKIVETEFSDAGAIMPDGSRSPHTTKAIIVKEKKSAKPAALPFTPAGKGPQFKGSVAPTQVAARLPETPTVSQVQPKKEFEPAAPQHSLAGMPIVEAPLNQLKISKDVPQFKVDADEQGVVEPLGGKFERVGVAPIQVWRRNDGSLEIISGRHRFDLARRSGETTIPAQIHDESKGFTADKAATLDAELNIRDGQGKARDYVNYFKGSRITREEADARGLLARALGKRSFTIATQGSEELIAALRADKISDEAAFYIALNAPNDSRLQAVGIKAILDGKSANLATNMMQAVKALAFENDTTLDMFGYDDSGVKEAEEMAKIAQRKQREIQNRLSAITGAAKNPAVAKAEGIDIKDPEAIKRRIEELRKLKLDWDNFSTNPDLIAEIRKERGVAAPEFELTSESEGERRAREEKEAEAKRIEAEKEKEAERKAKADKERDEFVLTGSDREADEAAARGQEDLFAAPPAEKKPEAAEPQEEKKPAEEKRIGSWVLGQRQLNAANRFIDSAVEQFGITTEQAEKALAILLKHELVKLDPVNGQFQLKTGRVWEKDVLIAFAEEADKPANQQEPSVGELEKAYADAKAALDLLGPEPTKPSTERQFFGKSGRAGADPDVVKKYDEAVRRHAAWKRKYNKLKKAEVDASNKLFHAKKDIDDLLKEEPAKAAEPNAPTEEQKLSESGFIDQTVKDTLTDISRGFLVGDLVRFGNIPGVVIGIEGDYVRFRPDAAKSPKAYQRVPSSSLTMVSRPDTSGEVSYSKDQDKKFGEEAGQLNANMGNLIQLLGANMYASNLVDVTIKELLQNAFDAVKGAVSSKKSPSLYKSGSIEITIDADERTISIKDDARGMTPQIVRDAFFTVAGSEKSDLDPSERSGGLGLAKMGFMLGAESLKLDTVRDGVRVTVDTTAKDIANSNFKIIKSPARKDEHGTTVTVKIPESYIDPKTGDSKTIWFPYSAQYIDPINKPLIGPVDIKMNFRAFRETQTTEMPIGNKFPADEFQSFKVTFNWGSADIFFGKENKGNRANHRVLSAGVYQFDTSFALSQQEKIPYDIIINVKPNVDARHPDYPFENSRERFKGRLKNDIESLGAYLAQIARGNEAANLQESFKGIVSMPRVEAGQEIADLSKKLRKSFADQGTQEPAKLKPLPKAVTVTDDGVIDDRTRKVLVEKRVEKEVESSFEGEKIKKPTDFLIDMKQDPKLPIFHNNTNVDYIEIGKEYGDPERFFAELGSIMVEMKEALAKSGLWGYEILSPENLFFGGVSIDREYGGVHIKVPYKAVLINPFYDFGAKTLFGVRRFLMQTMIHEIAHTGDMSHGVGHNTQMLKVDQYLADEGMYDYFSDAILDLLRRHESTFTAMREAYGKSTTRNVAKSLEKYGKDSGAASARGDTGGDQYQLGAVQAGEGRSRGEGVSGAQAARGQGEVGAGVEGVGSVRPNLLFSIGPSRFRTELGLYSALAEGIDGLKMASAPAQGWKDAIKGLVNKGQIKAEEVSWSGVNDWLDLQQGKVTKEQVAQYLNQGGVQVDETVLGDEPIKGNGWEEAGGGAKYASYTLSGGTNYREVLLTLPDKLESKDGIAQRMFGKGYLALSDEERFAVTPEYQKGMRERYKSTHWDQPNVLAHIRVNDRTDADGKKVLFVEEIQSDWGQEGKKKGFASGADIKPVSRKEYDAFVDKMLDDYIEQRMQAGESREEAGRRGINMPFPQMAQELDRSDEYARMRAGRDLDMQGGSDKIPAAPFVTKTEGWLNLALKRIMVMAAEGGYDRVAFVNGDQSAERYDLSKQIELITAYKETGGSYRILATDIKGNTLPAQRAKDATELEGIVGKELAQKISDQKSLVETYSGLDLKIGGEGMKAFYDKIIPLTLKKLLPKVGGRELTDVPLILEKSLLDEMSWEDRMEAGQELAFDPDAMAELEAKKQSMVWQTGFDITPAMRETMVRGVPLFSVEKAPLQEIDKDVIKEHRKRVIDVYRDVRAALGRIPKMVSEGKADISMQRNTTALLQYAKELQAAIKSSQPRRDTPEAFLKRAIEGYENDEISKDVFDVIMAAYSKEPWLLNGLLLSIRKGAGPAEGRFDNFKRVVILYKQTAGASDPAVVRHELAHSLEQMMLPEQRNIVIQEWRKAVETAMTKYPDERHQKFFNAVLNFGQAPSERTLSAAINLMPGIEFYQYVGPSEYWAVNAEPLLEAQLGSSWDRFVKAVRRLFEALKQVFGFDNKSAVHKVFAQVMSGNGARINNSALLFFAGAANGNRVRLLSIQDDKDLLERYNRPNTPMTDRSVTERFILRPYRVAKEIVQDAVRQPGKAVGDLANFGVDSLINLRVRHTWFAAGVEARDFERYNGQLRTSDGLVTASVAVDNAIRGGNIAVEVLYRGGIKYDKRSGMYTAENRTLGMRGVYQAQKDLQAKLGDQLATDIIQSYLEAKRSISIMNEFYDRESEVENAKDNLAAIKASNATPEDIQAAKIRVEQAEEALSNIKKAVSSVNMSDDEMRDFAVLDQKYPELRKLMDNWTAVNQNLLQFWKQVGLLSKGRYETLSNIKDYVPWYRIMNDGEDVHSSAQVTTRTLTNIGREKFFKRGRPISVIDFRAKEGQKDFKIQPSSVVRVTVNDQPVSPDLVKETPSGEVRIEMDLQENDLVVFETFREIENIIDNMTRNVMRMTMNGLRQYAANRVVREYATRNANGKIRVYPSVDKEKGRFQWIANGNKVVVEIPDPLVAATIYGLDSADLKMFKIPAAVANTLRRSITFWPDFQLSQMFKDSFTAVAVTGVKNPAALLGGVWKGFLTSLTNTDPVVDVLRAAGIGGFRGPARTPEAELKRRMGVMNRNIYQAVMAALDHISDSSDMAQRVATYKRVMAETGDETQALIQAANVINFLHYGASRYSQALVKLVPFYGAWMNATDALIRALMGSGLKGQSRAQAIQKLLVAGSMLSMISLLYVMLVSDSEEYEKLDDQTKLRNLIIPGTGIKIPINTSAAYIFKALPELAYNWITKNGTQNEMDERRLLKAVSESAVDMLLGPAPIPMAVKPVIELKLNRSFFSERNIIPDQLTKSEASEQYTALTSELGKWLSANTKIPGTDDRRLLNPIEADYLMRSYFGTTAAAAQWLSNSIGGINRPEPTLRETPIIGTFMLPKVPRGNEALFYDFKEIVEKKYTTWDLMIKREDIKGANEYLKKNRALVPMNDYITQMDSELQEINSEIRRIGTSRTLSMPPEKRRQEIEKLEAMKERMLYSIKSMRLRALKTGVLSEMPPAIDDSSEESPTEE